MPCCLEARSRPAGLVASLRQRLEEILPIHIVQEDVLAPASPAHDMIHGPRVLDAHLPRHVAILVAQDPSVKLNARPAGLTSFFYGLDGRRGPGPENEVVLAILQIRGKVGAGFSTMLLGAGDLL